MGALRALPAEGYHIIVFDLPGHGQSSFDSRTVYDAVGIARLLQRALAALGIEQYHLAGHTLGGWVATLLAPDRRQSVLTLALVDSAGLIPPVKSDFQHLLDAGVNPLLVASRADFDRLLAYIFHREPLFRWPGRWVLADKLTSRAGMNQRIWNDLSSNRAESSPELKLLGMPTLILWGDRDRIIDKSVVARFTQYLSHATVALMEACGHSPIAERPREVAACDSRFLINPASVADFHPSTLRLRAIESPNR